MMNKKPMYKTGGMKNSNKEAETIPKAKYGKAVKGMMPPKKMGKKK